MPDPGNDVSVDTSAADRTDLATGVENSYAQDNQVLSGPSEKTLTLLKDYVDTYLKQTGFDPAPVSTDNSAIVGVIESELGLDSSDPVLGPLIAQEIEAWSAGQKMASTTPPTKNVSTGADPIEMFSGQFQQVVTDLSIAGAGMNFAFRRFYKNQAVYFGPLGANWDHCYNLYIREWGINLIRSSGELREDLYTKHPLFGQAGFNYWVPPDGRHGVIEEAGTSYQWRSPGGTRFVYQQDVSTPTFHRIVRIEDRFGNYLAFTYDPNQRQHLTRVEVNHPARFVLFGYDTINRIILVQDHTGRKWTYQYDDYGDLAVVTSPSTDRYPSGLSTSYEYSSPTFSAPLQHNLLRIIDPDGQLYLENDYGNDPGMLNFNRVIRQRQGNGESFFEYEKVVDDFEFDYDDSEKPAVQVDQMLRNGQPVHFIYNKFGNMLLREEILLQDGLENLVQWRYRYNRDGSLLGTITPEGCVTQYYYGREDYLSVYDITDDEVATDSNLTSALRMTFGNLLAVVRRVTKYTFSTMDLSRGVWGDFFPDVLSATDPNDIIVKNTYEPDFQQLLTTSDPRFTASADPRGAESTAYRTHLTRYAYSALPLKTLAQIQYPNTSFPSPLPNGTMGLTNISDQYLQYDPNGRLERMQDAEGNISQTAYFPGGPHSAQTGYLQSVVLDATNLRLTTSYDVNNVGQRVAVRNPRGIQTNFVVNELNQVIQITSGGPSFKTKYFFNENGLLERQERDNLDDIGQPSPDGSEIKTYKYDEQNNLLQETIGGNDLTKHHVTRHFYDGADCRIETIFPMGNKVQFEYEERLLLYSSIRGAMSNVASTTKILYDDDGRKTITFDGRKNRTQFVYDTLGRIISSTDALGGVQQNEYDKLGNTTISRFFERRSDGTYHLLRRAEFIYDERGSKIRQTDFLFSVPIATADIAHAPDAEFTAAINQALVTSFDTQFFYNRNKQLFRRLNAKGQETIWEYDAINRQVREQDNAGNYIRTFYDENSNVIRVDRHELVHDPVTGTVLSEEVFSNMNEYDPLDRRINILDGLGSTHSFAYDSRNNLCSVADPLKNLKEFRYDVFGRKTFEMLELTRTGLGGGPRLPDIVTQFIYDDNNRLTSIVDGNGSSTQFFYDELDRHFQTSYVDGSTSQLTYDPDDNVVALQDNNGLQIMYQIDPLGRRTRLDLDKSAVNPHFPYSPGAEQYEQHFYDGLGRPLQRTNDFCQITTKVDSLGRAYSESLQFTAPYPGPPGPLTLSRNFDPFTNRTDIVYPSGRTIHYDYDLLNRVETITNLALGTGYPGSGVFAAPYQIASYQYRGLRLDKTTYGNQTTCDFSYDGAARLISTRHGAPGNPFLEIQQLFDGIGNRRFQLDNPAVSNLSNSEEYRFDSAYRLTRFVRRTRSVFNPGQFAPPNAPLPTNALVGQQAIDTVIGTLAQSPQKTYSYDAVGNRTRESRPGHPVIVYTSNGLNQYASVGSAALRYDVNGNLIDDGTFLYVYNYRNQLTQALKKATNTEVLRLLYDSMGRLIVSREGGQNTFFVSDALNVIEEYSGANVAAQYVYENGTDQRCQFVNGGQEWWYHRDLLSSPRLLSDSTGQPSVPYVYSPFGTVISSPPGNNSYLYGGKRFFNSIGVYDSRARNYSPNLGRFLQRDPKGISDGPNLYVYGGNNPVTYTDPLGTEKRVVNLRNEFLTGFGQGVLEFELEMVKSLLADQLRGGPLSAQSQFDKAIQLAEALYGAYSSVGGGLEGFFEAINTLNPLSTAMREGYLSNEAAGKALELLATGNAEGAKLASREAGKHYFGMVVGAVELGMTAAGAAKALTPNKAMSEPQMRREFRSQMLDRILSDPNHPLNSLVDRVNERWLGGRHTIDNPQAVQATHLTSKFSGAADRLAVEFANTNNGTSSMERAGMVIQREGVLIGNVPVERGTALTLARMNELGGMSEATVRALPSHPGWAPPSFTFQPLPFGLAIGAMGFNAPQTETTDPP